MNYISIIKKFQKRYVYSPDIDSIWTADLKLFPKYAKYNDGNKYILTVMDTFSKYSWVRLMKDNKITASNAFEDIIKASGRTSHKLWTDVTAEENFIPYRPFYAGLKWR